MTNDIPSDVAPAGIAAVGTDANLSMQNGRRYTLVKEFASVLNRFSRENESNTPDFILAEFMTKALEAFEHSTNERSHWYRGTPHARMDHLFSELDKRFPHIRQKYMFRSDISFEEEYLAEIDKLIKRK